MWISRISGLLPVAAEVMSTSGLVWWRSQCQIKFGAQKEYQERPRSDDRAMPIVPVPGDRWVRYSSLVGVGFPVQHE